MRTVERAPVDDASTRSRVARAILENGPATAAALGVELRLTPAAVRRHLDQLLAEGVIEAREQRITGQRGRGRPAKVFAVTDAGRDTFAHAYDELAAGALRYLAETGGDDAVTAFARHRLTGLEERIRPLLELAEPDQRPRVLAEALSNDGFAASVGTTPAGTQMCQHHCPVAHVAEEFPQMCEAETEMFARLLGSHVQRLATIAHGDGVCTTHLPMTTPAERLPS
ncbi:MAG: transcriptional regulator [Aeromicrobium sp.]|jgi:predicted ArsR family transcriptional regulator|uniref:helix-turn-helix transcriptional regulator n=1 Tax=Aeromicrobium sp. TaxID=1871063 RepID=UPI002633F0BA|nr:metalloregulator ArsR/SmtB family transcription factor [Aeromicrobium sp.]MCW2790401.1 transcriptional regulator [Aeromicrobium sp.]MCW2824662.1 transcriptional regulator [Aeromicrobium sp.]